MHAAIVGAGMSGLACAQRLMEAGARVELFDKARGPGGRMSTRRLGEGRADLGAQYFTARDPAFLERVVRWEAAGAIARWDPAIMRLAPGKREPSNDATRRWVGVPRMSALTRHLAGDLPVRTGCRVTALEGGPGRWSLSLDGGERLGPYERVVLALPGPQAAALLTGVAPALAARVGERPMTPCWSAALWVPAPGPGFDAAFVHDHALAWLARDGSKPGRPAPDTWVAHAEPDWSQRHLEVPAQEMLPRLVECFVEITGHAGPVHGLTAHRWRYARGPQGDGEGFLHDPGTGLAACGDWCRAGRVEGAWLSGHGLAGALAGIA